MTDKKKLGLSVGVTALLVSVISVLVIQIVHLSNIQMISLHGCGYDFPMDELVAESHLIARGKSCRFAPLNTMRLPLRFSHL